MRLVSCLVLLIIAPAVFCGEDRRHVLTHGERINTRIAPEFHEDHEHKQYTAGFEPETNLSWILHVANPITEEHKASIEKHVGAKLGKYLAHNSFICAGPHSVAEKARTHPHVLWVGSWKPKHKVHKSLHPSEPQTDDKLMCIVHDKAGPLEEVAKSWERRSQLIKQYPVEFSAKKRHIIARASEVAHLPHIAKWIAEQPESHWIEPAPVYKTMMNRAYPVAVGSARAAAGALTGSGAKVLLHDTGVDTTHCMLSGSSILHNTGGTPREHGTRMAAAIAGKAPAGSPAADFQGIAPDAELYVHSLMPDAVPSDTFDLPQGVRDFDSWLKESAGADVPIQVFGFTSVRPGYDASANFIDFVLSGAEDDKLVIFPSGNDGLAGSSRVSSLSEAKNVLTVGASQNDEQNVLSGLSNTQNVLPYYGEDVLWQKSSRGPAADGRIKPDIVMPGSSLFLAASAGADCTSGSNAGVDLQLPTSQGFGTSFAAAIAAGSASLIHQWVRSGDGAIAYGAVRGDLLKALMIQSAQPMNGVDAGASDPQRCNGRCSSNIGDAAANWVKFSHSPNGYVGHGRGNVNAVTQVGNPNFVTAMVRRTPRITTGDTTAYCFNLIPQAGAGQCRARITLAWNDPGAAEGSVVQLVNDLDVLLFNRDTGETYRPNGLNTVDAANNVEVIDEMVPCSGAGGTPYSVQVTGRRVAATGIGQAYALVVSGNLNPAQFADPPRGIPDPAPWYDITKAPRCTGGSLKCPNLCSAGAPVGVTDNTCDLQSGLCTCNIPGRSGADCSLTACPDDCNENDGGYCDFASGSCICGPGKTGTDCSANIVPDLERTCSGGFSTTEFVLALIGGIIIGMILGGIIGWFFAVKYLESQRKKRREQLMRGQS